MSEWLELGIDEQLEDLRNGTHPKSEEFEASDLAEILALPSDEARSRLLNSGPSKMMNMILEQNDMRIGFTIAPPSSVTAYISVNGSREAVEYEAEYELTSREIICRYKEGPTVFTISGDQLLVKNEDSEGYPKKITLSRASD